VLGVLLAADQVSAIKNFKKQITMTEIQNPKLVAVYGL